MGSMFERGQVTNRKENTKCCYNRLKISYPVAFLTLAPQRLILPTERLDLCTALVSGWIKTGARCLPLTNSQGEFVSADHAVVSHDITAQPECVMPSDTERPFTFLHTLPAS
ncbi:hypothetical protein PoB_004527300 [Plakobranchus ocellatus]|uniref:Uncharacterized protein n=1 Tax=Plakobranchus ocellatus TaxID=259542 RepID=A0AAV4BHV6_9GAST|nr:hypothetical protein PoB_004527300 [Plakobranchus ocellatus]